MEETRSRISGFSGLQDYRFENPDRDVKNFDGRNKEQDFRFSGLQIRES